MDIRPVQQPLLREDAPAPMSASEVFEWAWRQLPVKSRRHLPDGTTTETIYRPFERLLYLSSGIFDYYLALASDPRDALMKTLDYLPTTTWERKLRDRLREYEEEEEKYEAAIRR